MLARLTKSTRSTGSSSFADSICKFNGVADVVLDEAVDIDDVDKVNEVGEVDNLNGSPMSRS